jgi:cobalt/nickel transport system permease protein
MGPVVGPLWAVHIADGVLAAPWLLGGFVLAGLLAACAARRLRDEEIPRVALLAAAFFVASLLHVRLGPTSVHLLLNGLVGVVLGRRAALAIPLGLLLQAVLLGHGGFTTLGVNACVLTLPALLSGWLFAELHRTALLKYPRVRSLLVAAGTVVGSLALVGLVATIATNRRDQLPAVDLSGAQAVVRNPLVLAVVGLVAVLAAWGERRWHASPEFTLGLFVGALSVVATVTLNAVVLWLGGSEDWHQIVTLVVLAHLPLIPIESVILGFTVAFLARVKPELVGLDGAAGAWQPPAAWGNGRAQSAEAPVTAADRLTAGPRALLLAMATLLLTAGPAFAHRLRADFKSLPGGRVQVESWFDIGKDSPAGARVEVFGGQDRLLTEGKLDENGVFVFPYEGRDALRVVVSAGGGHRAEVSIPAGAVAIAAEALPIGSGTSPAPLVSRASDVSPKDVLLGVTFLLALAAFVLSIRNGRHRK